MQPLTAGSSNQQVPGTRGKKKGRFQPKTRRLGLHSSARDNKHGRLPSTTHPVGNTWRRIISSSFALHFGVPSMQTGAKDKGPRPTRE